MPTSPKATARPGGAKLKRSSSSSSKRPCKYGPRVNGRCPPKPRSSSKPRGGSSSGSGRSSRKAPCKYGPRDAAGRCPKKPKAAPNVRDYESVDKAARQAGQVLRSSKATKEQKHEAVKVLGSAVAGEVGKKVVEHIAKEAKTALQEPATRAALKSAARKAAPVLAALPTVAGIAATLYVGGIVLDSNRKKEAALWAARQLETTAKGVKGLTPAMAATLWRQYYDFALKQPVQNPFLGK